MAFYQNTGLILDRIPVAARAVRQVGQYLYFSSLPLLINVHIYRIYVSYNDTHWMASQGMLLSTESFGFCCCLNK